MALDPALMDKFERDWNEALEVYEARTTAARLGDTSVDPFRRTTLDPKVAAGMQSELFGPLSAKWGLLTEGAGRRSAAAPQSTMEWSSPIPVGGGEVLRFNRIDGRKEVLNPARPGDPTPARRPEMSASDSAALASLGRAFGDVSMIASDPAASSVMKKRSALQRDAIAEQMAQIEAKYKPAEVSALPDAAFEAKFAQTPSEMMRPIPQASMFMGDPMNPRIQDPPPAPLPVGPSAKRGLRVLEILREGN